MSILQVGAITVQRIVEHEIPIFRPSDFFDEATDVAVDPHRERFEPWALCPQTGRMVMPVQSYLVRTAYHCILIDTCVGCDKSNPDLPPAWNQHYNKAWLSNLEAGGASPDDIDYVFCTHLHMDHCGWNTRMVDGRWLPTFPNARYVFARDEYNAIKSDSPIFVENIQPILEAKQAIIVDMDYAIDDEIWLEPAVGHTIGHVAVHIKSGQEHAVMCGDIMHSPLQIAEPEWSPNFDFDPVTSACTRKTFLDTHCGNNTLVMTGHFPSPSIGRIITRGSGYGFVYA